MGAGAGAAVLVGAGLEEVKSVRDESEGVIVSGRHLDLEQSTSEGRHT